MANLITKAITAKGLALIAKSQGSGVAIFFTRLAVGDGMLPDGADAGALTSLIHHAGDVAIDSIYAQDTAAYVEGALSNAASAAGFTYRELGLFADDPDDGEILYAYGNFGADADVIPPGASGELVEKRISLIVYVGPNANVDLTAASGIYALRSVARQITIAPSDWVNKTYHFADSSIRPHPALISLEVNQDAITPEQLSALQAASLSMRGQQNGSVDIVAGGTVPAISVPVTIVTTPRS